MYPIKVHEILKVSTEVNLEKIVEVFFLRMRGHWQWKGRAMGRTCVHDGMLSAKTLTLSSYEIYVLLQMSQDFNTLNPKHPKTNGMTELYCLKLEL